MKLPEFLTTSDDGDICLTGHRIGLYHVVSRYRDGDSAEMIAHRYPTLPLSLVHRVIAFYLENQADVDAYVASCDKELDRQRESGPQIDRTELRRRVAASPPATKAE